MQLNARTLSVCNHFFGEGSLSQADEIRSFVLKNWIETARARGESEIIIRAGDVHAKMGLANAHPAICSAIGAQTFSEVANVRLLEQSGPREGANTTFKFALENGALSFDAARNILESRYGSPISAKGDYVVAFELPDQRQIAIQSQTKAILIWVEDPGSKPSVKRCEPYTAIQGRMSNLPQRLTHQPRSEYRDQGFPRPVWKLQIADMNELRASLTWYETALTIDRNALHALKARFLEHFPDFEERTFSANDGQYWAEERRYKQELIDRAQEAMGAQPAFSGPELGQQLLAIALSPSSNLLDWRTAERLKELRAAHPGLIEEQCGLLVAAGERKPPHVAIGPFVTEVWPYFAEGREANLPYADIRDLVSLLLALAHPAKAIAIRYQRMHNAGVALLHRSLFKNQPLSTPEYEDVLSLARTIYAVMRDEWNWNPRDLWDVQGFIWVACKDKLDIAANSPERTDTMPAPAQIPQPENLIFYGPPGTGKTYRTAQKAVELCDGQTPAGGRSELMARYRELVERKRIEFITFHQSYSYEEFIEGLRPEMAGAEDGAEGSSPGLRLVPRPGILQSIARRAESSRAKSGAEPFDLSNRQFFKMSLGRAAVDEEAYLFEEGIRSNRIMLGYGGEIDWSDPKYDNYENIKLRWQQDHSDADGNDPNIRQLYAIRSLMKPGDIVIVSDGNLRFRAIGEVVGQYSFTDRDHDSYYHQRPVKWLWVDLKGLPREEIYGKNFSQVSIYRLNDDFLNLAALGELIKGTDAEESAEPESYVLIIDEINRANISKVFGEIITLIEPDKRLGMENAISLTLPYSKQLFGLPANLHIVGTMNTADRSIALLDTALRRRFEFAEIMPDPDLLSENVDGINIRAALQGLNARIEYLFDRDHQIGHAYFMGCRTRAELDSVMRRKVIPLLVEYFYENWEKVRAALNEAADAGAFVSREKLKPLSLSNDEEDDGERWRYFVNSAFTENAFEQLKQ